MPLLFGKYRRFVILVVCIIEMLSMSGILYGWNSLVPVLKKDSIFGYLCAETNATGYAGPSNRTARANGSSEAVEVLVKKSTSDQGCSKQDSMLSNAFIVGTSFQFIVAFPGGLFYDRVGLRVTKLTNGVVFLISCLLMALVSASRSFLIFPGVCLLSVAATFSLLTNLQIGSLFPAWQYLIISMYSGGFDSSSIMMQLVNFGNASGISMMTSFLILGIAGVLTMFFIGLFLFPAKSLQDGEVESKAEASSAEEAENLNTTGEEQVKLEVSDTLAADSGNTSASLSSCLCSAAFISQVLWFSCILLRFNFFLTGYSQHLNFRFGGPGEGPVRARLITALSLFLFMGILVAPLAGFITDCFKKRFARGTEVTRDVVLRALSLAQALTSLFALLLCALMFAPGEAAFYACYVAEVFTRAFLFSLNSAYFLTAFPKELFGQLFGICFLIGGVLTQLQYALLQLSFLWSNAVLLLVTLVSFVHPLRLSGIFQRCFS